MRWIAITFIAVLIVALVAFVYLKSPRYTEAEVSVSESYWYLPEGSAVDASRRTNEAGIGTPLQLILMLNGSGFGQLKLIIMEKKLLSPLFDEACDELNIGLIDVENSTEIPVGYKFKRPGDYYAHVYWDDKLIHRTPDIHVITAIEYVT